MRHDGTNSRVHTFGKRDQAPHCSLVWCTHREFNLWLICTTFILTKYSYLIFLILITIINIIIILYVVNYSKWPTMWLGFSHYLCSYIYTFFKQHHRTHALFINIWPIFSKAVILSNRNLFWLPHLKISSWNLNDVYTKLCIDFFVLYFIVPIYEHRPCVN